MRQCKAWLLRKRNNECALLYHFQLQFRCCYPLLVPFMHVIQDIREEWYTLSCLGLWIASVARASRAQPLPSSAYSLCNLSMHGLLTVASVVAPKSYAYAYRPGWTLTITQAILSGDATATDAGSSGSITAGEAPAVDLSIRMAKVKSVHFLRLFTAGRSIRPWCCSSLFSRISKVSWRLAAFLTLREFIRLWACLAWNMRLTISVSVSTKNDLSIVSNDAGLMFARTVQMHCKSPTIAVLTPNFWTSDAC
jgi:hypothetical protein